MSSKIAASRRRRRKRKLSSASSSQGPSDVTGAASPHHTALTSIPALRDDTDFRLTRFPSLSPQQSSRATTGQANRAQLRRYKQELPWLLWERETGSRRASRTSWQRRMLVVNRTPIVLHDHYTYADEEDDADSTWWCGWRTYARRKLAFTRLGTHVLEAILGLDNTGSFLIAVSCQTPPSPPQITSTHLWPTLLLRFLVVPSPSAMAEFPNRASLNCKPASTSPVSLLSIPLSCNQDFRNGFFSQLWRQTEVYAALSSDSRLAIVRVVEDYKVNGGALGHILVFFTPWSQRAWQNRSYSCLDDVDREDEHVEILRLAGGDINDYNTYQCSLDRRALSRVSNVPVGRADDDARSQGFGDHPFRMLEVSPGSAYLFMIPRSDGVRLTWIRDCDPAVTMPDHSMPKAVQPLFSCRPTSSLFSRPVEKMPAWQKHLTHKVTDQFIGEDAGHSYSYDAYTGKIQVAMDTYFDVMKLALEIIPSAMEFDVYFDAVGVNNGGRSLELVIRFLADKEADDLFVFVEVDLFTRCYDWKKLDNMERKIPGDRCAEIIRAKCLGYAEHVYPAPIFRHYPGLWIRPELSKGLLYPDCYVVDNKAILHNCPMSLIEANEAPICIEYA